MFSLPLRPLGLAWWFVIYVGIWIRENGAGPFLPVNFAIFCQWCSVCMYTMLTRRPPYQARLVRQYSYLVKNFLSSYDSNDVKKLHSVIKSTTLPIPICAFLIKMSKTIRRTSLPLDVFHLHYNDHARLSYMWYNWNWINYQSFALKSGAQTLVQYTILPYADRICTK